MSSGPDGPIFYVCFIEQNTEKILQKSGKSDVRTTSFTFVYNLFSGHESSQYSSVSSGSSIPSLPATPTFNGSIPAARGGGGEGNLTRGGSIGNLTPGGLSSASIIKGGSTRAARPTSFALKPLDSPQKSAAFEKGFQACLNVLKLVDSPQKNLRMNRDIKHV